jgi:hypothetical protein
VSFSSLFFGQHGIWKGVHRGFKTHVHQGIHTHLCLPKFMFNLLTEPLFSFPELVISSNGQDIRHINGMLPIQEGSSSSTTNGTVVYGVVRSRTLPSRRKGGDSTLDNKENSSTGLGDKGELVNSPSNLNGRVKDKERGEKRVLKKQRRVSSTTRA